MSDQATSDATLDELFPNIKDILKDWESPRVPPAPTPFDSAAAARFGTQQQFVNNGQPAPAGQSVVEDGEPSGRVPAIPSSEPPAATVPEPTDVPPVEPSDTPTPEPADQPGLAPTADESIDEPFTPDAEWVSRYQDFDNLLRTDPQLQQLLATYLATGVMPSQVGAGATADGPQPTAQPPLAQPAIPPELDLDDPAIRALWNEVQTTRQQLSQVAQSTAATQQRYMEDQRSQSTALANRAIESFRQQHGLTPDEANKINMAAARLNVLPSLLSGIDPITGAPAKPDTLSAVERAMEIAYFQMPEFRQREFQRVAQRQQADNSRKQKLAGVSGSSGSVPRQVTPQVPTDPTARREAAIAELARYMAGEPTE